MSVNAPEVEAQAKVDKNPYDTDSWNILLREKQKLFIAETRPFYESLIAQFPNAGRYWRSYIEHELRGKNFEHAEKLFQRCITKVLSIDLWKCYLQYVREAKGRSSTFREQMAQMYDFALDKIGMDVTAYSIYADYIAFLRQVPTNSQQEFQKIGAIRKVFHRGVCTPVANVEQLWADYCAFEKNVNANLAEKLITERQKDYQIAKRTAKQLEVQQRGIQRNVISTPPRGNTNELKQVEQWKKYIQWEKENPLTTPNLALLTKRVSYAYEQALLCLGFHPDVWYEAAAFLTDSAQQFADRGEAATSAQLADEVAALYERATTTMLPNDSLLCFAYADYEETRMKYKKCETIYRRYIDNPSVDPSLAYIQYMKFARRTEGIAHARSVFKMARDDARCSYHVYVAAALTEYYCSKDSNVAMRIFDLGFKKNSGSTGYAEAYIEFVAGLNEDNGTRVLFERILGSGNLPADKALRIWDLFLAFETRVGDLASIAKVDRRRRDAVAKEYGQMPTLLLIDRYKFLDLRPCNAEQLVALGYQSSAILNSGSADGGVLGGDLGVSTSLPSPAIGGQGAVSSVSHPSNGASGSGRHDLIAVPDPHQMCPFKPKVLMFNSYAPLAGGIFQPPPTVAHLLQQLPPPNCFNGPHVQVDTLIDQIRRSTLPDDGAMKREEGENGGAVHRLQDVKKDMYKLLATTPDPSQVLTAMSRKRGLDDDDDHLSQGSAGGGVAVDVYKQRLNKRQQR